MREDTEDEALISCTCVTFKRPSFLLKAIECFRFQTYKTKELIIIYEDTDIDTINILSQIKDANIKFYQIATLENWSLGRKRNFAIEQSLGAYFCQWDDDDWYHSRRVELQFKDLQVNKKEACILLNSIVHDLINEQSYITSIGLISASLLCSKRIFQHFQYTDLNVCEDEAIVWNLMQHCLLHPMIRPELYIYVYHGKNTMIKFYFDKFYSEAQKMSPLASTLIQKVVNHKISVRKSSSLLSGCHFQKELRYFNWLTKVTAYLKEMSNV